MRGTHVGRPSTCGGRRRERRHDLVAGARVPRDHDADPPAPARPGAGRRAAAPRRCRRRCRRRAAPRPERLRAAPRRPARSSRPRATCTTRATAGERDPAAGLGGDQLLVADDGDAQAAAGATSRPAPRPARRAGRRRPAATGTRPPVQHVGRPTVVGRLEPRPAGPAGRPTSTSAALVNVEPEVDADDDGEAAAPQPRARSRSAIRSSAVSMPTREPDQVGGHLAASVPATLACVIRPGCSISDSTPPSDSPRVNTSARSQTSSAAASPPADPEATDPAEALHLPGGDRRGRGAPGSPG